ncbi:MAG: M28 family peptidase [Chloroflexota bacterium]|nr:M28 family peptidase [Chloroflexota bacterium]
MTMVFNEVSGTELARHLAGITNVVRLSGTPEEAAAFVYIERELKSFGYDVTRYESDALIGYPATSSLALFGQDGGPITCNGYSLSPSTGPDGVTAGLVYAGAGGEEDYAGIDARGKIVLTDGLAMPGKGMAAERAGAVGQIHGNDEYIHEMCISPIWGTPVPETASLLPTVPAVGITGADADRLKGLLRDGPLEVRLVTEPFRAWVKIPTLIADLAGQREDRYVLFSGHVDSWHLGVMDNGTANATQLEVGRLLAERRRDLRRGVRLAFWSGHSHGRYAGSTWYADTFWQDLHDRCVCHVNVDSVGAVGATIMSDAPSMAETHDFGQRILTDTIGETLDYRRISRSSDQSFWGHGIPSLFAALSEQPRDDSTTGAALAQLLGGGGKGGGLGWWWHTTEDTADKIDPQNFRRDAGIYAETLWRLCTEERLPFDLAAEADEIVAAAASYDQAAGEAFDLSGTVALARELAAAIRSTDMPSLPSERANQLSMDLSRILIPVNYTRSGPFNHDLALRSQPLPGLAAATDLGGMTAVADDSFFVQTQLLRERNRLDAALRSALKRVTANQGPA